MKNRAAASEARAQRLERELAAGVAAAQAAAAARAALAEQAGHAPAMPRRLVRDLTRTILVIIFMGALIGASLWIMVPFIGPVVWATMIVVATWPMSQQLQRRLWNKRWLSVTVMGLALLLLFVVPLTLAIGTIVGNAEQLASWARLVTTYRLPAEPPAWVAALPVVGSSLVGLWEQATAMGVADILPKLTPYAGNLTTWIVGEVGNVGMLAFQFLVTLGIALLLYATGDDAAHLVRRFAVRLAGERGAGVVELAGGAIRGVALGVGVTAVVQSLMGGLGLAMAGMPFTGLLTALMFMLCIAQVGPLPVLLPASLWVLFGQGDTGWGIFLLVWSGTVGTIDNFIRPVLIRLGADLPLMLIFAGVIGGLFAFGLVGIFVGPVVLAVAWTLLEAWLGDGEGPAAQSVDSNTPSPPAVAPTVGEAIAAATEEVADTPAPAGARAPSAPVG
jgi:predicted PurR-regulated permease PerM